MTSIISILQYILEILTPHWVPTGDVCNGLGHTKSRADPELFIFIGGGWTAAESIHPRHRAGFFFFLWSSPTPFLLHHWISPLGPDGLLESAIVGSLAGCAFIVGRRPTLLFRHVSRHTPTPARGKHAETARETNPYRAQAARDDLVG